MADVNPAYLDEEAKHKIRKSFLHGEFPAVIIKDFFSKEFYAELKKKAYSLSFKRENIVLRHSYAFSNLNLSSRELCDFVSFVTKKKIEEVSCSAYLLSWKDYMILNDKYLEKTGIDVIIDLTEDWNPEWGGVITYTDGKGTVYPISPAGNSVAIVERKKDLNKYIQYINHYGEEKKRLLLIATL